MKEIFFACSIGIKLLDCNFMFALWVEWNNLLTITAWSNLNISNWISSSSIDWINTVSWIVYFIVNRIQKLGIPSFDIRMIWERECWMWRWSWILVLNTHQMFSVFMIIFSWFLVLSFDKFLDLLTKIKIGGFFTNECNNTWVILFSMRRASFPKISWLLLEMDLSKFVLIIQKLLHVIQSLGKWS